jgi:hypothetical protein
MGWLFDEVTAGGVQVAHIRSLVALGAVAM